jgi:pyruvate/2-oxoglutarate/acetoin dehydrogenase E1 component
MGIGMSISIEPSIEPSGPANGRPAGVQPAERVGENLNRALHELMGADPTVYLLGEDVIDPYGGTFKVTKGLATRFPDRVLSTPLSEGGFVGVAIGLALSGDAAIAEMMFSDFVTLAFDPIVNFAAKSVSMYGRRVPMRLLVRCPTGGGRGYGPTHSQSLQKHFLGVPHLRLAEISAFHDSVTMVDRLLGTGEPAILFEDKVLYSRRRYRDGIVDDLFHYDFLDEEQSIARVFIDSADECDCLIIAPGGMAERAVAAARRLFLEQEITCQVVVPFQLYPFDVRPVLRLSERCERVAIVEESTPGGTWGGDVACRLYEASWGRLRHPVIRIESQDSVIPTAKHLEEQVLVQESTIYHRIWEAVGA